VFAYTIDPRVKTESGTTYIQVLSSPLVTEYIGNATSTKQDIITQSINFGGFVTPGKAVDNEFDADVKTLYEKAQEKLDMPLPEKIKAERQDGISRTVKKLTQ
jgi:hypothetical protein